ncbi:hypothetical protein J6590_016902 [Homalodisca vitripennis]|nr:hypothetical protein J6590_016902 [Homalodisca vitripennis]
MLHVIALKALMLMMPFTRLLQLHPSFSPKVAPCSRSVCGSKPEVTAGSRRYNDGRRRGTRMAPASGSRVALRCLNIYIVCATQPPPPCRASFV